MGENKMDFELPEAVKFWSQFFHPTVMLILFGTSLYAAYLGLQVQRTRNTEDKELKKELGKQQFNVKHYQVGSALLALVILGAIGGMGVTYINNGKLFTGPHLFTGLGIVGTLATSASLAPFMQKGNNWARITHIVLNFTILGLFTWQAITGIQIVFKLLSD